MKHSPCTVHISPARMGIIVVCNYEDNVQRDYQRSKAEDKNAADEEGAGMRRKGSRENEKMERGGERLPWLYVSGAAPPLVSFVLCISMIKRWWNRAAGRSLDTETMLSLEQASTAAEQQPRDPMPTTHTLVHTHAVSHTCRQTCKHTQKGGLLRPRGLQ